MNPVLAAALAAWIRACALTYGVEPEFALAVARVESGTKTECLRVGALGRSGTYYGPFGIHRQFLKKWPVDDPWVNCEVGVKALRGADKRRVLRRYNASFNEAYWRAVMGAYRQEQRTGRARRSATMERDHDATQARR